MVSEKAKRKDDERKRAQYRNIMRLRGLRGEQRETAAKALKIFKPATVADARKLHDAVNSFEVEENENDGKQTHTQTQERSPSGQPSRSSKTFVEHAPQQHQPQQHQSQPKEEISAKEESIEVKRQVLSYGTQFGDMRARGKGLVSSDLSSISSEKVKEVLEGGALVRDKDFIMANVNYSIHETRKKMIDFDTMTTEDPESFFQEYTKSLKENREIRRRREETMKNPHLESAESPESHQDDDDDIPEYHAKSKLFLKLEMKLDNVIGRKNGSSHAQDSHHSIIWTGWTLKRVVERRRKIAAMLEAKAKKLSLDDFKAGNLSKQSSTRSKIQSFQRVGKKVALANAALSGIDNPISPPAGKFNPPERSVSKVSKSSRATSRSFQASNRELEKLQEEVERAKEALKSAEIEAAGQIKKVCGIESPTDEEDCGQSFLRRKSKSVQLVSRVPEKVKTRHPSLIQKARHTSTSVRPQAKPSSVAQAFKIEVKRGRIPLATRRALQFVEDRREEKMNLGRRNSILERQTQLPLNRTVLEESVAKYLREHQDEAGNLFNPNQLFEECGIENWVDHLISEKKQKQLRNLEMNQQEQTKKIPARPKSAPRPTSQRRPISAQLHRRPRPTTAREERSDVNYRFSDEPVFTNYLRMSRNGKPAQAENKNLDAQVIESQEKQIGEITRLEIDSKVDAHLNFIYRYMREPAEAPYSHVLFPPYKMDQLE